MMAFLQDIVLNLNFKDKLLVTNYDTVAVLISLLLMLAVWKYWNFMRRYSDLQSYSMLFHIGYAYLFRKIPKNIPFTCFFFQKVISVLKDFEKEGLCVIWFGRPFLTLFSEEAFKIFSNEQEAVDKLDKYDILREFLGTGLLTSNGETWRKDRKLLTPVFHVGVLKGMLPIFNEYGKILKEKLSKTEGDSSVDVLGYLKYCSLNILFESIFGFKINNQVDDDELKQFIKNIDQLAELAVWIGCNPALQFKFMWNIIPYAKKTRKVIKECDDFFEKVIAKLEESVLDDQSNKEYSEYEDRLRTKSFGHILMGIRNKDPSFTAEDFKSQIVTFIAAGYDTTAYTMMWCLFMLGLHPDVQEQVLLEIESLEDDYISFANLQELRYLECVIKETMRIYTPVPMYGRCTTKDIQCGKYLVPKGTDIMFCSYMLHRDPKIYSNPEKFMPERFLGNYSQNRPWTYTTFSEGIRSCLGKRFVMMEMMVMLAHTVRNFKITSLDKREDVNLCWNVILTPSKPPKIKFTSRR